MKAIFGIAFAYDITPHVHAVEILLFQTLGELGEPFPDVLFIRFGTRTLECKTEVCRENQFLALPVYFAPKCIHVGVE